MWNQEKLVVLTKCYNTGLESPDTRAIPPSDRARAEFSSQVCVAAVCTPPPAGYSGADGQKNCSSISDFPAGCVVRIDGALLCHRCLYVVYEGI